MRVRITEPIPRHSILPEDVVDDSDGTPLLVRKLTPTAHQEVRRQAEAGVQTVLKREEASDG